MTEQSDKQLDNTHAAIVGNEMHHGKCNTEIEALKNTIKILNLEHKVEIMEKIHDKEIHIKDKEIQIHGKEIQLKDKEIQIKDKEIQILKLNKMLKLKYNDVEQDTTSLKNEKQTEPIKDVNEFFMMTKDLLTKGITKFFGEELQNSYSEWFEVMAARLMKNTPFIFEKSVLVKVTCKDRKTAFAFYSDKANKYTDQYTDLDIFNKGWTHDATSVFIPHPNLINKSIQMKESCTSSSYHEWKVDSIPEECIGKDGFFIVLCLKNKNNNN